MLLHCILSLTSLFNVPTQAALLPPSSNPPAEVADHGLLVRRNLRDFRVPYLDEKLRPWWEEKRMGLQRFVTGAGHSEEIPVYAVMNLPLMTSMPAAYKIHIDIAGQVFPLILDTGASRM